VRRPWAAARRSIALVCLAAAGIVAGCGGITAPDLFLVQRSGSGPGARLTLIVNEEGGVRCNGGRKLKLSDPQLVQARAIQEDIRDEAAKHTSLAQGAKSVFSYSLRDENGSVSFSDDSAGQPPVFRRLQLFVLQVAQQVCRLAE
jgi:hypothetical protein